MSQNSEIVCSNCHSHMPAELRFCRNCGFRLTQELDGYGTQYTSTDVAGAAAAPPKRKKRMSGISWLFIGLLVFFVGAAAFTALVAPIKKSANIVHIPVVKSYIGADGFNETDKGVILEAVSLPNGPADKAGLVGGDVIVSLDGQAIHDEDQIDDLMTKTPIGKTVDVEYIRDGEKKTTKLTTISQDDNRRLTRDFERRPEGRAQFGYEDGDTETVDIPGTKIRGVKLNTILRSRPADIAGVKNGDIVTEFDGVPIRTPEEFLMRVRRALPYSMIKLVVMRPKSEEPGAELEKIEIPLKMGKQ